MTAAPPVARAGGDPAEDLRVARIHLRMGLLTLARAELEDLLGRDALDTTGLAILAEARWRSGDGEAAAEAAEAHLEAGGVDAVAICIAAEAAAADGRPGDARILMDRLPRADAGTLDAIFAGLPRRAHWPAGPVDQSEVDEIRRESGRTATARPVSRGGGEADGDTASGAGRSRAVPGPREVLEATGDWESIAAEASAAQAERAAQGARGARRHAKAELDPLAEIDRAHDDLDRRPERAFLRLALALRADPTLAPLVLETIRMRREPAAELLRGDAQRLLGRHLEAEAAFDAVSEALES